MGSVRSVIHAGCRSPISRGPLALNLLSRKGSLGCSLCPVHEASDFPYFPTSFARKGGSRLLARIDGLHDRGDWKANGTGLSADFRRAPQIRRICIASGVRNLPPRRTGNVPRIEQCVCHWSGRISAPKEDHTWAL